MSATVLDPVEEIRRIEKELMRRKHLANAPLWVKDKLNEQIWSGQRKVLHSVSVKRRTAVKSCHEVGKSFIAARAIGWWIDTHPLGQAFVVTTAPTAPQVEAILWREFGRVHSKGDLPGRLNQTEWWIPTNGKDELIAFGRKPADTDPTAFQGIHAPYVLFVGDEACGLPKAILEAADSLVANDNSKVLLIGNPDDPESHFATVCKPGSDYNVIEIGAFDTPNFTGEPIPQMVLDQLIGRTYVEEKRKQWAPNWYWVDRYGARSDSRNGVRCVCPEEEDPIDTDPFWQSKILGKFPKMGDIMSLIPEAWIRAAQERSLPADEYDSEIGLDVGGGGDSTCGALRRGGHVRIKWEDHNPDTMQTCGLAVANRKRFGATRVKVDSIGIGRGVADRAKELNEPFIAVNVGEAAEGTDLEGKSLSDFYINKRAQYYWELRERFQEGAIDLDPNDNDLALELSGIRFKRTSSGKIQIESKDEMKKRKMPSPNRAEAVMLAFANVDETDNSITW
jgi:hypothetical protein